MHLTAKTFMLVAFFLLPLHIICKPGIEAIRSQYGLSGVLPENETIVGQVSSAAAVDKQDIIFPGVKPMEDDYGDLDYENSDNVMSRSLFSPQDVVVALKPKAAVSPESFGKCVAEVLTSSIVKPYKRVPQGNGSNPSLSLIETCCEGYTRYVHNKSLCVAVCREPCHNALCVRPNVCECYPDHVSSLSGECTPTCPIGCLNGQCHWNGTCECNPGYVKEPNNKYCIPYCSRGCGALFNCTAPETCSCVKGYQLNSLTGKCDPFCRIPCGNGNCVMPDVCSCFTGFRLVDGTCQANCTRGCVRGRCVANEVCMCNPGYMLDAAGINCEPYCKKGCPNGKCIETDKCSCDKGYKRVNNQCKPNCPRGCIHGICTAPNTCSCGFGYRLNSLGRCKKTGSMHINLRPLFNHVFNSPTAAHPAPPPSRIYESIDRAPQTFAANYGYAQQNVAAQYQNQGQHIYNPPIASNPLYNPPMQVYPTNNQAAAKPIFSATVNSGASAPQNIPSGEHSSMYDRQPAYNPFLQPAPAISSANHNPNYLEPQPAFNPYFPNPSHRSPDKERVTVNVRRVKVRTTGQPNVRAGTSKSFSLLDIFKSPKHTSKKIKDGMMTTSRPLCDKNCLNGKCTGLNQCTCNSGYKMAIGSKHKCVAHCPAGCWYGTCASPGVCTCNISYKKRNGKCVKV